VIPTDFQYLYPAKLVKVVDGDTVDLTLDLGFRIAWTQRFRLYGVDTPELNAADPAERVRALAAKQYVADVLTQGPIIARTHMDKADKYGRWLAVLIVQSPMGPINVNETLIAMGLATYYVF
jgi:micrococcal nuclease